MTLSALASASAGQEKTVGGGGVAQVIRMLA
jgi:hypothetical protein